MIKYSMFNGCTALAHYVSILCIHQCVHLVSRNVVYTDAIMVAVHHMVGVMSYVIYIYQRSLSKTPLVASITLS